MMLPNWLENYNSLFRCCDQMLFENSDFCLKIFSLILVSTLKLYGKSNHIIFVFLVAFGVLVTLLC